MITLLVAWALAFLIAGTLGGTHDAIVIGLIMLSTAAALWLIAKSVEAYRKNANASATLAAVDSLSRDRVGYDNPLDNANGAATATTAPRHDSQEVPL